MKLVNNVRNAQQRIKRIAQEIMTPKHNAANPIPGLHVAIIMDGNGRWAHARHKPRFSGHRAGAEVVREIVENAPNLGIGTLTLYTFSSDNWQRPSREVNALMRLFHHYLQGELQRCVDNGVRVNLIGRRDRLSATIIRAVDKIEAATLQGHLLHLRLAIDYSARDAILLAAQQLCADSHWTRDKLSQVLAELYHPGIAAPEVDLLIRTGGEQRLSDFMLWECAYAELYFTPLKWPDFDAHALAAAIRDFHHRERRFGRIPPPRQLHKLIAAAQS